MSADASPLSQPAPGCPAGFWQRSVAWSIDATLIAPIAAWLGWPWISASVHAWIEQVRMLLQNIGRMMGEAILAGVSPPQLAITLLHDPALYEAIAAIRSATWTMIWPALLAFALVGMLYHVAFECSPWQASAFSACAPPIATAAVLASAARSHGTWPAHCHG